jgi:hypothetical protein
LNLPGRGSTSDNPIRTFPSAPRWGVFLALGVLFGAQIASAQTVVILEFSGDKRDQVRTQLEATLKKKKLTLVPIAKYKAAAAKKKLRGDRAMTPQAVAKVATVLDFDAAVEGAVGKTFFIRILDPSGNELWSKELPMGRGGMITWDNARRLAQAVATAAKLGGKGKPPPEEEEAEAETPVAPPPPVETPVEKPPPAERPTEKMPEVVVDQPPPDSMDSMSEAHTITDAAPDPDLAVEEIKRPRIGPRLVTFRLGAVSTWRSYCSRPGVTACKDYDSLPEDQKFKDTVDLSSKLPYFGFGGSAELFPFASFNNLAKGLGLAVGYSRGFSLTEVTSNNPAEPAKEVIASDEAYFAQLLARYYFGVGPDREPLSGFAGVRFGVDARNFDVDLAANTPLPGSHRRYLMFGADAGYPFLKWLRLEVGGSFYLNPAAGAEEVAGYGQSVSGFGFALEGGFGGEITGPFGYTARFRMSQYKDTFSGAGSKWTQTDKGVAQEAYTSIVITANAQF